MASKNKFGFGPIETPTGTSARRERSVGPMGAAVRDAAESLQEATEAKVEQRRQNAEDAKTLRAAKGEGRLIEAVPLSEIHTSDLPRDRLALEEVANSDEMEELKSSIRVRGQREPVELYRDAEGRLQLKKGWRRFTALSQLFSETGDAAFGQILARIEGGAERIERYVDMVEENVIREDLTFAEMAQLAITAAADAQTDSVDADTMVARLYGSLHKMKRSYVRRFVFLLQALEDDLKWPKAVPRNLGVDVARSLASLDQAGALRARLRDCATPDAQNAVLAEFLTAKPEEEGRAEKADSPPREKFEFHVGPMKVTARRGECRIVADTDFATLPKGQLEEAVRAFQEALAGKARIRNL